MDNDKAEALEAKEYTLIRAAVSDCIEKMPGIEKYYGASRKYCEINNVSDPDKGVGVFDLQGAKYTAKYIDGSFSAQYPFSVLLRKKCTTDKQNLDMTGFMDNLGEYIEKAEIKLDSGRKITEIIQTIATFENSRSESNVITLQADFLIKYRKDD